MHFDCHKLQRQEKGIGHIAYKVLAWPVTSAFRRETQLDNLGANTDKLHDFVAGTSGTRISSDFRSRVVGTTTIHANIREMRTL